MQSLWPLCLLASLSASLASSDAHLYNITIETGMPHLEENLRYTTTHTQHCLTRNDLDSAFPILDHPSLSGCKLREQGHGENTLLYALTCEHSTGTTGSATWQIGDHLIRGTLRVRLGGKNMTFFQRVSGTLIGECPSTLKAP